MKMLGDREYLWSYTKGFSEMPSPAQVGWLREVAAVGGLGGKGGAEAVLVVVRVVRVGVVLEGAGRGRGVRFAHSISLEIQARRFV